MTKKMYVEFTADEERAIDTFEEIVTDIKENPEFYYALFTDDNKNTYYTNMVYNLACNVIELIDLIGALNKID